MGFDPITMAIVSGGAKLIGGAADRRAAGKQANQANAIYEQRANEANAFNRQSADEANAFYRQMADEANVYNQQRANEANVFSRQSADEANAMAQKRTDQQIGMLNQARGLIGPAYQRSGDIRQQALNRSLGLAGQMFMPQMQSMQGGNFAAQQAILGGLPAQRAALLGGRMPAPAQAQMLPFDQNAMQGFINPTAPNLRG